MDVKVKQLDGSSRSPACSVTGSLGTEGERRLILLPDWTGKHLGECQGAQLGGACVMFPEMVHTGSK